MEKIILTMEIQKKMIKELEPKNWFFYIMVIMVNRSLTVRYKLFNDFVNLWNFLYNLKITPDDYNKLMKYCMDVHNHLKSQSDFDGIELCTEIDNTK